MWTKTQISQAKSPDAEEISQKIPLSSFSIIPGGHASNIEHPKELTTLIRDFLNRSS